MSLWQGGEERTRKQNLYSCGGGLWPREIRGALPKREERGGPNPFLGRVLWSVFRPTEFSNLLSGFLMLATSDWSARVEDRDVCKPDPNPATASPVETFLVVRVFWESPWGVGALFIFPFVCLCLPCPLGWGLDHVPFHPGLCLAPSMVVATVPTVLRANGLSCSCSQRKIAPECSGG